MSISDMSEKDELNCLDKIRANSDTAGDKGDQNRKSIGLELRCTTPGRRGRKTL